MPVRTLQNYSGSENIKNAAPASNIRDGLNNNRAAAPNNPIEMSNTMNSTVNTNYTTNPLENKDSAHNSDAVCSASSLRLFASYPPCVGGTTQTSFATEPTEMTIRNAGNFFQFDHTPIKFTDGHASGDNFEYALAILLDIDNSHSDNPAEWIHQEDMEKLLQELGLNYWIVASRNHWRSKEGEAARPRFHGYLPLAAPLHDADKFALYCLWCIKTLNSDPKVRLKSQKLFGYGDNPKQFFRHWDSGRCIDEVVTDADLADIVTVATPASPEPAVLKSPPPLPPAVMDYLNAGVVPSGDHDFDGIEQRLRDTGLTFAVAQILCGLTDGNRPDDPERHQPCPITDCKSDDDGFYYRPNSGTFHCRRCGFNSGVIGLVRGVHSVAPVEAFDMVSIVASTPALLELRQKFTSSVPAIPKNTGKNSGNGNRGNEKNVQNNILHQSEYPYSDERGLPKYKIVRKDFIDANGESHKEIYPISLDADGNSVCKEPETLYPFRLLELLRAGIVYIVEGEKCANCLSETLAIAGCKDIAVTTSQGGAQRGNLWKGFIQRYPAIATKIIRILPDNDEPGRNYAQTVATAILEANPLLADVGCGRLEVWNGNGAAKL